MKRVTSFVLTLLLPAVVTLQFFASGAISTDERSESTNGFNSDEDHVPGDAPNMGYAGQSADEDYPFSGAARKPDDDATVRRRVTDLLRKMMSDAKNEETDREKSDEDASVRRGVISLLMKIMSDAKKEETDRKKRTCKVNLGGNCATEEALSMADNWHFLNSAWSPGRRRRHVSNSLTRDSPKSSSSSSNF